jgi:hypothetical protein
MHTCSCFLAHIHSHVHARSTLKKRQQIIVAGNSTVKLIVAVALLGETATKALALLS